MKVRKICPICRQPFIAHKYQKYCSDRCAAEAKRIQDRESYKRNMTLYKCECRYCGEEFMSSRRNAVQCGKEECVKKHEEFKKKSNAQRKQIIAEIKMKDKTNNQLLREAVKEAEKLGLSYGVYMARYG